MRFWHISMAFPAVAVATGLFHASGASADPQQLAEALRLREVIEVMREEGVGYGADLEAELFPGRGGAAWQATVDSIYDAEQMQTRFIGRFTAEIAQSPRLPAMIEFFGADQGRQIVELELSARRAMLDETVDADSRVMLEEMMADNAPRLELIDRFVQANDLVETNVVGALNSNLAFYRGMIDGSAFDFEMSEGEMLAAVWSQEDVVREETSEWLYAYLSLAYRPLSDAVLEDYIAFSESPAGRELNRALFASFDDLFVSISHDLGRAAARYIRGQDL